MRTMVGFLYSQHLRYVFYRFANFCSFVLRCISEQPKKKRRKVKQVEKKEEELLEETKTSSSRFILFIGTIFLYILVPIFPTPSLRISADRFNGQKLQQSPSRLLLNMIREMRDEKCNK